MPEMEVEPDGGAADAKSANKNTFDEILRAQVGEGLVEGQHQRAIQTGCGEQSQLRARAGRAKHRIGGTQHVARMWLERHSDSGGAECCRARDGCIDDGTMSSVHAVEISDCSDCTLEGGSAGRIVVYDAKRFRRSCSFGHMRSLMC